MRRALIASALIAVLLMWVLDLTQPEPVSPVILPVGTHSSAEAFARSQARPDLPLRASVERDHVAALLFGHADVWQLVVTYRSATGGWSKAGGLGPSSSSTQGSADRLQIRGLASAWSAPTHELGGTSYAWIALFGTTSDDVPRVEVTLSDGSEEPAVLRNNAFLWFDATRGVPPPERCGPRPTDVRIDGLVRIPRELRAARLQGTDIVWMDYGVSAATLCN